jgi:uncharacterized membrane protein
MQRRAVGAGRYFFAAAMIGLAVLAFLYDDFALVWQKVPAWVPGYGVLAYGCALVMLGGGAGLLFAATAAPAARLLLIYTLLWLVLLRVPAILIAPARVISWSGSAETAVIAAGAWTLCAQWAKPSRMLAFAGGATGLRGARILLGAALIPCGVAHFAYAADTAALVPAWLPAHLGWAYFTGAGFIAAGVAILSAGWARLAALLATFMMAGFTLLVWLPGVAASPHSRLQWTALFISLAITAGAWVVADANERAPGLVRQRTSPAGA